MLLFPKLSSGAVAQYPLPVSVTTPVEVIWFIDGVDQRFLSRGKGLRSWHVQLAFLNENEIQQIQEFFEGLQGQYASFAFPDPYSGQLVLNCRFGSSTLITDFIATDLTSSSFWVEETNG